MIIIVVLTLIILVTLFVSYLFIKNEKLTYYKMRIDKAEEQIEKELDNRYDIVKEIQKTIEKSTKKELKIYKDLDELKNKKTISTIDYDNLLDELVQMIYLIETDYPKISKKKDFRETITKLDESNTLIRADKTFFNDNNKELNSLLKVFPTNVLGKLRGIKILPNYEIKTNEDDNY